MIFGDTETTGLLKPEANELVNQPHLLEIYFVKLELVDNEFVFVDEYETLVKPPIAIPEFITQINGISNEMVANAPTFPQIYKNLCNFFLGEHTFVAHNCPFDIGVIWCELARMGKESKFPWPYNQLCTVELSFPIENKKQSLAKLHTLLFGQPHDNAHRAKGDVEAMVRCYNEMVRRGLI